jgi:RNA-directed DNA polymerase
MRPTSGVYHSRPTDLVISRVSALEELMRWLQPVVRGWVNYYGRFYPSALPRALYTVDALLVRWAQRKYKWLKGHSTRAWDWLERLKSRQPNLLPHWCLAATVGR